MPLESHDLHMLWASEPHTSLSLTAVIFNILTEALRGRICKNEISKYQRNYEKCVIELA